MIYIGIDPGASGAIAFVCPKGNVMSWLSYPDIKMANLLSDLQKASYQCVIEKLWGMPLRGSMGNWSLGSNYGRWQLLLELAGVSLIEAAPQTWQKAILHTTAKKSAETKIVSLAYVNKRFPELNLPAKRTKDINLFSGVSDAICMALYCRQLHLGIS